MPTIYIDADNNPLRGGLIGNLAKELSEEISLEDMNLNLEDTDDIGSVLTNLISGENPMKFMDLVQNVGNKIQDKISKNNIKQSDLLSEAQNMMGLLGNNNPLFDNILNQAKKEMSEPEPPSNPTRDRLRKKLEARKKKK